MRRWASALLVAGIVGALVGVGAPAYGVEPVAPPVPESPYKTSQLYGYTQTEWDSFDDGTKRAIANRNYALLDEAKRILAADPDAGVDDAPKPAGTPSKLLRGAGVLGLVMAVPMIVNGALQIVGVSAEVDASPDEMICAGVGSTANNVFLSMLYGEVECVANIPEPNLGLASGSQLAYGSMVFVASGAFTYSDQDQYCYVRTGEVPSGLVVQMRSTSYPEIGGIAGLNNYTGSQLEYWRSACGSPSANAFFANVNPSYRPHVLVLLNPALPAGSQILATETTTSANPDRLLDCEVKWSDGSTTVAEGVTYKETEGFPLGAAGCTEAYSQRPSPGVLPEEWSISSTPDEGGSRTEVASGDIPDEAGAPAPAESTPDSNRGLRLLKVVGTQALSCMTWEVDCADWWEESEDGSSSSSPYRCWYGSAVVDLKECGIYRNSFKSTATRVITEPSTGEDVEWGTGTSSTPNSTSPGSFPTPGDACFSSWPSVANPVAWVLHPVKCALVAAFVPRDAKVNAARANLGTRFTNSAMGSLATAASAATAAITVGGSGCGGLPFRLEGPGGVVLVDTHLLAACDEPAAGIAAFVRGLLIVVLGIGSLWVIIRFAGSLFGFTHLGDGWQNHGGGSSRGVSFK